jgi:hypothetical protein
MVTVTCTNNDCPNGNVNYNFFSFPPVVECGGCHTMLQPYDQRDDPPPPPEPPDTINA